MIALQSVVSLFALVLAVVGLSQKPAWTPFHLGNLFVYGTLAFLLFTVWGTR